MICILSFSLATEVFLVQRAMLYATSLIVAVISRKAQESQKILYLWKLILYLHEYTRNTKNTQSKRLFWIEPNFVLIIVHYEVQTEFWIALLVDLIQRHLPVLQIFLISAKFRTSLSSGKVNAYGLDSSSSLSSS